MMHDVVRVVHEPECDLRDYELSTCRACEGLRAAYKRGRGDAADEILKAGYQQSLNLIQAVTIARGGEQK